MAKTADGEQGGGFHIRPQNTQLAPGIFDHVVMVNVEAFMAVDNADMMRPFFFLYNLQAMMKQ